MTITHTLKAYAKLSTTYDPTPAVLDDPSVSEAERIRRLCPYCQHGDAVMFKVGMAGGLTR